MTQLQVEKVLLTRLQRFNSRPARIKPVLPVAAALLSIVPVVPAVDAAAEMLMEPTLGAYLGLEFHPPSVL